MKRKPKYRYFAETAIKAQQYGNNSVAIGYICNIYLVDEVNTVMGGWGDVAYEVPHMIGTDLSSNLANNYSTYWEMRPMSKSKAKKLISVWCL